MKEIKPQRGHIREREILLKEDNVWLHFANPYRLITASKVEDIWPALQAIERSTAANNWYAAGFLS